MHSSTREPQAFTTLLRRPPGQHKRNARGELCISVIIDPTEPAQTPDKVPD